MLILEGIVAEQVADPWIGHPGHAGHAQLTNVASIGTVVIRQPSSDQISATMTGLGSGAMNTGTGNVRRHGPAR